MNLLFHQYSSVFHGPLEHCRFTSDASVAKFCHYGFDDDSACCSQFQKLSYAHEVLHPGTKHLFQKIMFSSLSVIRRIGDHFDSSAGS